MFPIKKKKISILHKSSVILGLINKNNLYIYLLFHKYSHNLFITSHISLVSYSINYLHKYANTLIAFFNFLSFTNV